MKNSFWPAFAGAMIAGAAALFILFTGTPWKKKQPLPDVSLEKTEKPEEISAVQAEIEQNFGTVYSGRGDEVPAGEAAAEFVNTAFKNYRTMTAAYEEYRSETLKLCGNTFVYKNDARSMNQDAFLDAVSEAVIGGNIEGEYSFDPAYVIDQNPGDIILNGTMTIRIYSGTNDRLDELFETALENPGKTNLPFHFRVIRQTENSAWKIVWAGPGYIEN